MSLLRDGENVLPNLQKLIVLSDNIEFYSTVVSEHIKSAGPVGGGYDFEFKMKNTVKSG